MPLLKRELHRIAKGPGMNGEDQWRLVFDTDAKRLYVEHEWHHTDLRGGGSASSKGRSQMDIGSFLGQLRQGPAHWELQRLLSGLFEGAPRA